MGESLAPPHPGFIFFRDYKYLLMVPDNRNQGTLINGSNGTLVNGWKFGAVRYCNGPSALTVIDL